MPEKGKKELQNISKEMEKTTQNETQVVENEELAGSPSTDERAKYLKISGIATAVIAVAIAVFAVYSSLQKDNAERAALALSRVQEAYASSDVEIALNGDPGRTVRGQAVIGLREIASKYSGVEPGRIAALYAGNIVLSQKNYSEAESFFDQASASSDDVVKAGAFMGKAAAKEGQGQLAEAAALYERAAKLLVQYEQDGQPLFAAAVAYKKANNTEKSRAIANSLLAKGETSEYAGQAKALLAQINANSAQ